MTEPIQFPTAHIDDLASLRLAQSYDDAPVERILTAIKVGRPDTKVFFRVRAGEEWRGNFALLQFGDDRDLYLVVPALQAELAAESRAVTLYTVIDRNGVVRLWPVGLPVDGRDNDWFISARCVAEIATTTWVRLVNQKSHWGGVKAVIDMGEPTWPQMEFGDMVRLAFRDRIIDKPDHPVILKLQGRT